MLFFFFFPMILSSVASFLFPIFASYKALKTADPAQLTPWLMYWVVFSCLLLVESWFGFILFWVPFYSFVRLLFLLYLVLPNFQGARQIYEDHIHPFLQENENYIDEFIASSHDRLKAAGLIYLKQAIDYVKENVLGLPPSEAESSVADHHSNTSAAQSYTSSLLARFSVPSARWSGNTSATAAGVDFYNFLAGAVATATSTALGAKSNTSTPTSPSGTLIPSNIRDSTEKMSFLAAQRERLNLVLSALDREAQQIQKDQASRSTSRVPSTSYASSHGGHDDEEEPTQRPPSGLSMWSALSKSKSETDFEKIEADSGAEDDENTLRRRKNLKASGGSGGGWGSWGWSGSAASGAGGDAGDKDDGLDYGRDR